MLLVIFHSMTAMIPAGTMGTRKPQAVCSLLRPISSMINAVRIMIDTLAISEGCSEMLSVKYSHRLAPLTSLPKGMTIMIRAIVIRYPGMDKYRHHLYGKNATIPMRTRPMTVKISWRLR